MLDREMLYEALHKEIPILTTQIRKLYAELDQKFHLEGAKVPMTFGMDRDCLGSYTQAGGGEREHFHFSLLFVGYSVEHPKFGAGSIEKVEQRAGGVHLHIRFEDGVRKMDQKWVLQTTRYRKAGDR